VAERGDHVVPEKISIPYDLPEFKRNLAVDAGILGKGPEDGDQLGSSFPHRIHVRDSVVKGHVDLCSPVAFLQTRIPECQGLDNECTPEKGNQCDDDSDGQEGRRGEIQIPGKRDIKYIVEMEYPGSIGTKYEDTGDCVCKCCKPESPEDRNLDGPSYVMFKGDP